MCVFRHHKSTTATIQKQLAAQEARRGEQSRAVKAVKANAIIENARKGEPCGAIEMEMQMKMKMKLSRACSPHNPHKAAPRALLLAFYPLSAQLG